MLQFNEKVYDGPVDTSSAQYARDSTWQLLGRVDQLYIQVRCGQSTVASTHVKVDIEMSNDGQSFNTKGSAVIDVTMATAGTIYYGQYADAGTSPNGAYVRLKFYSTTGPAFVTCWVAGRAP